jgi:hypothetical protein
MIPDKASAHSIGLFFQFFQFFKKGSWFWRPLLPKFAVTEQIWGIGVEVGRCKCKAERGTKAA